MADLENKIENQNPPASEPTPPVVTSTVTPAQTQVAAPTLEPAVQAPIVKKSPGKGKRLSPMTLAIWCVFFFVVFVALAMAAGYAGIQNPKALDGLMTPAQAKSLLMIVSWAFFWILFLVSFTFLWLNGYRLSKAKNTPKLKLIIGIIISFMMLTVSITVWAVVITRIQKIDAEILLSSNLVIWKICVSVPYETCRDPKNHIEVVANQLPVVAPVEVFMSPGKTFLDALTTELWVNDGQSYSLSCGNGWPRQEGQIVEVVAGEQWFQFLEPCLYTKKWTYDLTLNYTYLDKVSLQTLTDTLSVWKIEVKAEIDIKNDWVSLGTNDNGNEILAWNSPARVVFDAKNIFTDLWLDESRIIRSFDAETEDATKENKAFFSHNFTEGKLHRVYYRLPGSAYPLIYNSFPIRTLPSDIPQCTITTQKNGNGWYTFAGQWSDGGNDIENIRFEVYNLSQERVVQNTPTQNPAFNYTFQDNQQYIIRLLYNTLDGWKWFCESDTINANSEAYSINSSLFWKSASATNRQKLGSTWSIYLDNTTITATQAPFDLQVRIDSLIPELPRWWSLTVLVNDQAMKAVKANLYEWRIYGSNTQILKIFIDDGKGNTVERNWNIVFNQDTLVGTLNADKVTWPDPLVVSFDASTIEATEAGDEIIYYTWDFGNGTTKENVTQSRMTNTYLFNTATNQWVYNPTVTIQTKKWYKKVFRLSTPISVTRRSTQVQISSSSHPTQIARVWDKINITAETDWLVTAITWDFGDGTSPKECEWRSCTQIQHVFSGAGTFTVRATVEYKWLPTTTNTIRFKIE